MLPINYLAATAVLITSALANGAAIVRALGVIDQNTFKLNNTIVRWKGALPGYNTINKQSDVTLASINQGISIAEASANLTFDEAIDVATATLPLIDDLNITLINFIAAQPKFAKLCKLKAALDALKQQKAASDEFSATVITKVPSDLQQAAGVIVAPIDEYFGVAVANYTAAVKANKDKPCKPPGYGYGYGKPPHF